MSVEDSADGAKGWIFFGASLNQKSADALKRRVDSYQREGVDQIHLIISSAGGDPLFGIDLHSYLHRLPIKVVSYNISLVQSAAVPVFCAGSERYCVPEATFMMHKVLLQSASGQILDSDMLRNAAAQSDPNSANELEESATYCDPLLKTSD